MENTSADSNINTSIDSSIINPIELIKRKPQLSKLGHFFDVYKNRNLDLLYVPVTWDNYFQKMKIISVLNQQQSKFRSVPVYINQKYKKNGVVLCFHGGGQTALSFCQLSKQLRQQLVVIAYDMAGHGKSEQNYKEGCLNLQNLVYQGIQVCKWVLQQYPDLPIMLIGHSLGGSIATYVAKYLLNSNKQQLLKSLIMIDSIQGNVITKKQSMIFHLKQRKQTFVSEQQAIKWIYQWKIIKRRDSARASVPGQLEKFQTENGFAYRWKVNLLETQSYWDQWYQGLSKLFISLKCHKMLMTQSFFSLDDELKQALRQQKFQMITFEHSGHFIHEDQFQKVGRIVLDVFKLV